MTRDTPLLEVRNLCKYFPVHRGIWSRRSTEAIRAVDDVSFDVSEGETLGLVGESGSGKSTTAQAILQLVQPTSGSVRFRGVELTTLARSARRKVRREIQIVFQDPYSSLDPRMKVGAIIQEPLNLYGIGTRRERQAKVHELIDLVGLESAHTRRYPRDFSGGQRQRIAIARALALDPKLVICDEAVSALDVSIQAQILNLLRDLQDARRLTYIFISHDLGVVRVMSDRIAVMTGGKIVEIGDAASVYKRPQHEYTKRLLAAAPVADPTLMSQRKLERRQLRRLRDDETQQVEGYETAPAP